jgi:(E)-4-hydroxy-3-methylbut-2-enyl-diphosphate synthase
LRQGGIDLISCPTCGRCQVDLLEIARVVEEQLPETDEGLKVAVMGCTVNGPGEARDADVGIAGGRGKGMLFKRGLLLRRVPEENLAEALIMEIKQMLGERKQDHASD